MAIFSSVLKKTNTQDNPLYEGFQPSLYIPTNARLSSSIQALTGRYITEIYSPKRRVYNEWIKMIEKDPIVAFCAGIKVLRAQITFGEYTHDNKEYQEFVRANLTNMRGSWRNVLARLASAMTFGCAVAEVNFSSTTPGYRNKWVLKDINVLDIRNISARGCGGQVEEWGYRDRYNNTVYINHRKCIHVTNTDLIPFNTDLVWGSADCERALNWYKLRQLVSTEFAIAAKNNATGVLWGQTNSTQRMQIYDADDKLRVDNTGKPLTVSKQKALYMQLKELENNDLIVTDADTNLQVLQTQTGEAFWQYAFDLIEKNLCLAFGIPQSLFREGTAGTFGNTGLSQNHKSMLDAGVQGVVEAMREEMINKVVKPLLVFNFGESKDFGKFEFISDESAVDRNNRIATILSSVASGIFQADDTQIQTEIRKSLGIPPQSQPEKEDAQALKTLQTTISWLNQQAAASQAKSQITENALKEKQIVQQDPTATETPVAVSDTDNYP